MRIGLVDAFHARGDHRRFQSHDEIVKVVAFKDGLMGLHNGMKLAETALQHTQNQLVIGLQFDLEFWLTEERSLRRFACKELTNDNQLIDLQFKAISTIIRRFTDRLH